MPIIQITVYQCEICKRFETTTDEVVLWSDPLVSRPNGQDWNYIEDKNETVLACPECIIKQTQVADRKE